MSLPTLPRGSKRHASHLVTEETFHSFNRQHKLPEAAPRRPAVYPPDRTIAWKELGFSLPQSMGRSPAGYLQAEL